MRTVVALVLVSLLASASGGAQMRTMDPNLAGQNGAAPAFAPPPSHETASPAMVDERPAQRELPDEAPAPSVPSDATAAPPPPADARQAARASAANTYKEQDVLTAADGVFGKGAAGLAGLIERIFREQGQPTAYIAGREVGGAFVLGVRYGSGTLFHRIEGQRPINWTGPSIGFDLGANGARTFVLIYNLYDTQDLYRRFPAAEGNLYALGGFTASYLRHGDVVVIPIRLGLGVRLGVNAGYMRFTEKPHWAPF